MKTPKLENLEKTYCNSLTKYSRRQTREVAVGNLPLGANNPIRIQSMTTVDTMDTQGSIAQIIRMVDMGCEYARITAPSIKEAENLKSIKYGLKKQGYTVPLIADIHFTPNAAELAARIVEKVRINPGNYADKKKFDVIDYSDEMYKAELERIRQKFTPLVKICKEYGTAMRIGTNHGSLSDRIMSRYGDTPLGMVESALEFLRICEDLSYYNIVISMKASNPQVMIQAYRLLVHKLDQEGLQPYPLHLGVTEAGEAEDGRIKSAVGIGTLLEDGLGDTVRVSLTEAPEAEIPVAKKLVAYYQNRSNHTYIEPLDSDLSFDPFSYQRRETIEVENLGNHHVPRIIADFSCFDKVTTKDLNLVGHFYLPELDKWKMNDLGVDYIYTGKSEVDFMLPNGLKEIKDYNSWEKSFHKTDIYPLFTLKEWLIRASEHKTLNFIHITDDVNNKNLWKVLNETKNIILILSTQNQHAMAALRRFFIELDNRNIKLPVIVKRNCQTDDEEKQLLYASIDTGGLLSDGFGDGVMLSFSQNDNNEHASYDVISSWVKFFNNTAFGILQATRTRITKAEYISCPSCGRTLFDLQETTAMIRKRTDHLKGIKIGIMGCIVNGPGEMADADYGYVGSGKGKITLYRGKEVVKRSIPSDKALDELIALIKEDGRWMELS